MDETRLCPSSFTHDAPLNKTSGIQRQNHPRNLLDRDMDMNNFLPWPQQAAGGTVQSISYMAYSHYRIFILHSFRGCLGHLLICSILISTVGLFFLFSPPVHYQAAENIIPLIYLLMTRAGVSSLQSFVIWMALWLWHFHPSSPTGWYLQINLSELSDFYLHDISKP